MNTKDCPRGPLEPVVGRICDEIEAAIKEHCAGGDLQMTAHLAARRIAAAEVEPANSDLARMTAMVLKRGLWRTAPCCLCGYNGAGYFQPATHRCAAAAAALD